MTRRSTIGSATTRTSRSKDSVLTGLALGISMCFPVHGEALCPGCRTAASNVQERINQWLVDGILCNSTGTISGVRWTTWHRMNCCAVVAAPDSC